MSEASELAERRYADMFDFRGRVGLVTGGARGLGFGIARRMAECGATTIIADLNQQLAEQSAKELEKSYGVKAQAVVCDVSNEESIVSCVASIASDYPTIDLLVNNAGIFPSARVLKMDTAQLDAVLNIDLRSLFLVTREVGRVMVDRGTDGRIVNISSMNAFRSASAGVAHYDAAKAGVIAFTRSMAIELGRNGIRVNAIAPGLNLTEGQKEAFGLQPDDTDEAYPERFKEWVRRIPARRVGMADDQARAVTYLLSDAASYVTGACLVVDGGASLV